MTIMKNPPIEEAEREVKRITSECNLIDIILLDQWKRNRESDEWRLTYLSDRIGNCSSNCQNCSVYEVSGGKDDSNSAQKLVITLIDASDELKALYAGGQQFLNCKSLDQYIASFATCFVTECHSLPAILDELDYVVRFKVVYWRGREELNTAESEVKKRIVNETIAAYSNRKFE